MTEIRNKITKRISQSFKWAKKKIDESILRTSVLDITILIESLILAQDERWRRA